MAKLRVVLLVLAALFAIVAATNIMSNREDADILSEIVEITESKNSGRKLLAADTTAFAAPDKKKEFLDTLKQLQNEVKEVGAQKSVNNEKQTVRQAKIEKRKKDRTQTIIKRGDRVFETIEKRATKSKDFKKPMVKKTIGELNRLASSLKTGTTVDNTKLKELKDLANDLKIKFMLESVDEDIQQKLRDIQNDLPVCL